ncbi:mannosyl-3-phosphoglycerate synthase [Nitrososphaera sp.]|uniref:mannosyl-3-phosphoglycerate synthase n=1 Tax=Nitrososphaera sp. TaxID=1971748 RepID=UPI00307EC828
MASTVDVKLDFPRYTERLGAASIHAVQRIYELDSGKSKGFLSSHQTIKKFDYDEISNILHEMAIVVPVKEEKLKLLEGVLSGIPNECLVIIVSNSPRGPVDRFAMEAETVRQLDRFMDKRIAIIHQRDPALGELFKKIGYTSILDSSGSVRNGKAEGMVIGLLLAKMYDKDYVGFIDSDNYVPGAVNEYVKIFAAGFGMASTPYTNVRVSWVFKPKVRNNSLQFSKWGRVSEITNRNLNALLAGITGFETEVIKTGNSGEHALSMPLAECLHFSSGYSVEPYEIVDIFEKFGGLIPTNFTRMGEKGVEIFQIETRNPHFHEDKGKSHLNHMLEASLGIIAASKICPDDLRESIQAQMAQISDSAGSGKNTDWRKRYPLIEPVCSVPMAEFAKGVREKAETFFRHGGLK